MNNYTWLEQKLHQFALSSQFMREVTFDFESTNISSSSETENHIFVTGLARAGTTILLNALYKSSVFASLTYSDMPFVLAPNLWSKISFKKIDLEVNRLIRVGFGPFQLGSLLRSEVKEVPTSQIKEILRLLS